MHVITSLAREYKTQLKALGEVGTFGRELIGTDPAVFVSVSVHIVLKVQGERIRSIRGKKSFISVQYAVILSKQAETATIMQHVIIFAPSLHRVIMVKTDFMDF